MTFMSTTFRADGSKIYSNYNWLVNHPQRREEPNKEHLTAFTPKQHADSSILFVLKHKNKKPEHHEP